jgi:hypothetical protein
MRGWGRERIIFGQPHCILVFHTPIGVQHIVKWGAIKFLFFEKYML